MTISNLKINGGRPAFTSSRNIPICLFYGLLLALPVFRVTAATVWLDELDLSLTCQSWAEPHRNQSVDGHGLSIGGQSFKRGLGTHCDSVLYVNLNGQARSFSASAGVDGEVSSPRASIEFFVRGDGKELWRSGVMRAGEPAKPLSLDLSGVKTLTLVANAAGGGIGSDHADWVDARFDAVDGARIETVPPPTAPAVILTPAASPNPRINGAKVFGVRPGSPFMFTIPATGERPMTFSASGLPKGLELNPQTGRITGSVSQAGEYKVTLRAQNARGAAKSEFKIVVGDKIALTPPMGWNSWNCFAGAVSEEKIRAAADAMVRSGLINHGWTYINVDDFWQNHRDSTDPTLRGPVRDSQGYILPNARFPEMKGMVDYIHSLGLKAGLYSSPGPWTCGGCAGSWQHEAQDAAQYAAWGVDYLKYDWCSYKDIANGKNPDAKDIPTWSESRGTDDQAVAAYPFLVMGKHLRQQNRDIVFNLCQYGMKNVWEWGASVNGNSWRTTSDIYESWISLYRIGFEQDKAAPFTGPGHWTDPDMLIVGKIGWGNLHPTHLTPNEQYTHISLWCLLSAPLLIGCDMTQLDAFTLNLLENDEVLAVDQDPLGKQAITISTTTNTRILAKDLADGSKAVGLFNLGEETQVQVKWSGLGLKGKLHVRDLWRQKDLGKFNDGFATSVPNHGVMLIRVW